MVDIKTTTAKKLAKQLQNMGFKFMIVGDGGVVAVNGDFEYHVPVAFGEVAIYMDKHITDMKPGDVVQVPYGNYPPQKVANAASSRSYALFGRGNYATHKTDTYVEVLCIDRDDTI
jgi:mannose-6-phosphate isomerase-like protein (cupin superfamily)